MTIIVMKSGALFDFGDLNCFGEIVLLGMRKEGRVTNFGKKLLGKEFFNFGIFHLPVIDPNHFFVPPLERLAFLFEVGVLLVGPSNLRPARISTLNPVYDVWINL